MQSKFLKYSIILLIFIFFTCREKAIVTIGDIHPKKYKININEAQSSISDDATQLEELSMFFSGRFKPSESSKLNEYSGSRSYLKFQDRIQNYWHQYERQILIPLKEWSSIHVSERKEKVVIYPFSGPDFLNAYTIYPKAEKFILIGLEPGGMQPKPEDMPEGKVTKGLNDILSGLDSISRLNYFITNKMKVNISASGFPGTGPIFLTYMGFLGIKPIAYRPISIDREGNIQYISAEEIRKDSKLKKGYFSLEIIFRDPINQQEKLLYYISTNISNQGIISDPNAMEFLKKQEGFVSTFKAASFLVHYGHFSFIKDFIISRANLIVMDDTGPKIKDLEKEYDLEVYGKYTRPISLWPEMFQVELEALHKKQNMGPLPFRYGYGTLHKTYHIIIAKRKNPIPL
ncbi:MAG: hypothetical protein H7A24_02330 [Leptospiraceae bacterium]|nr:hypothetical protein [Leptospiraceae bacterium]MCP5510687.1 hypothetical protein [Leptospiraceae bacterium]